MDSDRRYVDVATTSSDGQKLTTSSRSTTIVLDTVPLTPTLTETDRSQDPVNEAQISSGLTPTPSNDSSHTPSVHNAVLARRNILSHIRDSYRTISRTNRILLTFSSTFSLSLVIAMIVVLIVTRNKLCDRPLRAFLILYVVKFGFGIPLTLVYYLHPDGRYPQYSSSVWVQWADRMRSLLDFLGIFFFIMGNYFLFTSNTCEATAPPLFGMSLALVILGYFMIAIPVLLCATAVFCLPCFLIVLRAFRLGPDNNTGAKPEEIKSLALLKYRQGGSTQHPNTTSQLPNITSASFTQKFAFFRKLKSKLRQKNKYRVDEFVNLSEISDLPEFRVADSEDAVCVICLEEYRDEDLIRQLHCNHHFHQQCLDEWLLINKFCPLCKASVCPVKGEASSEP